MRRIEREEERCAATPAGACASACSAPSDFLPSPPQTICRVTAEHPSKQCFHLCIVNLVIGTLYCAKVSCRLHGATLCPSLRQ